MAADEKPLPARLTTAEVCEIARYGPATLRQRVAAGAMPAPIDRGQRGSSIYDRDAVLKALRITNPADADFEEDPWMRGAELHAAANKRRAEERERVREARKRK